MSMSKQNTCVHHCYRKLASVSLSKIIIFYDRTKSFVSNIKHSSRFFVSNIRHCTLFSIPFSYRSCTAGDIAYLCIAKFNMYKRENQSSAVLSLIWFLGTRVSDSFGGTSILGKRSHLVTQGSKILEPDKKFSPLLY
jgi:hypothetical protein